jgi:hypothetical protein
MKVHISYVGFLHLKGVTNHSTVDIDPDTTIEDFLVQCGMKDEHRRLIVPVVNGVRRTLSYILEPDDSIFLHLPAGGG